MMFKLKSNMGTMDRVMRIVVGTTLLAIGPLTGLVTTDLLSKVLLGSMGTVALLSAVFSYCFLYDITGFDTFAGVATYECEGCGHLWVFDSQRVRGATGNDFPGRNNNMFYHVFAIHHTVQNRCGLEADASCVEGDTGQTGLTGFT